VVSPEGVVADRWSRLVAAVQKALAAYPPDVAQLVVNNDEQSIQMQPRNDGAAAVEVSYWGTDEIYLGVGMTDSWIWDGPAGSVEEVLYQVLAGVMAGRFEEAGGLNSSGRVQTSGREIRLGGTPVIPRPWRWRRRHTYAPYA
jgi:hypothetical protein